MILRVINWVIKVECALFVVFQLVSLWYPLFNIQRYYAINFIAVFTLTCLLALRGFLSQTDTSPKTVCFKKILVASAFLVGLFGTVYIMVNAERLETMAGLISNQDMFIGFLVLGAFLVVGWFSWGPPLTIALGVAMLYFLFGDHAPAALRHLPYSTDFVISYTIMTPNQGIFWLIPLSADVVFYLFLFTGVLGSCGVITALLEMGKLVGRRIRGGAAYPAVVGSSLVGTFVGQAVANVVITGRVTIPGMKKAGFSPEEAASIETVASAGSLIMPPIMGMGAFIMAYLIGCSYIEIALAAVIPAVIYFITVFFSVYIRAEKAKMPYFKEDVNWSIIARVIPTFIISITVLTIFLLRYYSPGIGAFWAMITAALMALLLQGRYRIGFKELVRGILEGTEAAARLGFLFAMVGPMAQTVFTTGLGITFANYLISSPFGQIPELALVIAMCATLITGMAIPEAAAYVVMAISVAPFLMEVGIQQIPAHLFIFYFSVFATITPPVALSALAAADIAGAKSYLRVAAHSMRLVPVAFLMPFVFALNPIIVAFPAFSWSMLLAFATMLLGSFGLTVGLWGFFFSTLSWVERVVVICGALSTLVFSVTSNSMFGLGSGVLLFIFGLKWWRRLTSPSRLLPEAMPTEQQS